MASIEHAPAPDSSNHHAFQEHRNQSHPMPDRQGLSAFEQYNDRFSPEHKKQVLDILLENMPGEKWFLPGALVLLAEYRDDPLVWGYIATVAKWRGIFPPRLEQAVDAYRMRHANSHGNSPDPACGLRIINAEALRYKILPPETWVIDGILPAGCTVFAGRSKDGKSQLGYGIAVAVATGGAAFGAMPVAQGDVLYLALEDGERRAQKRLQAQCDRVPDTVDLSRLDLVLWEAPTLGNGLERELDAWIASKAAPRLIIIDILEKVRPRAAKHGNVYAEAYAATASLTQLAQERNIAILVVHHVSKIRSEDIRDAISGPVSLLGGADTFWVLKRISGETDATLAIGGRDVAEQELALQFKDGFWTLLGGAEQYRLSKTRQEIIQCLVECARPQTPRQLGNMLPQIGYEAIKKTLQRMADDGQIINLGGGRYGLRPSCDPPARDAETDTPPVPGVPAVPDVPIVPAQMRDSACTRPVPQHGATHPLKTNVFEDFGDKGTAGTPDAPETVAAPLCPACHGRDLVSDAKGHYCVTCRCRFSHR